MKSLRDGIHATYLSTSSIQNFSLAIVDLLMGHCDLALVRHLGVPAVLGYWSHQLVGGEALLTAASLPASHVPFVVGYTDEMSFFQRIVNYAHRLAIRTEIWYAKRNLLIKQDPGSGRAKQRAVSMQLHTFR